MIIERLAGNLANAKSVYGLHALLIRGLAKKNLRRVVPYWHILPLLSTEDKKP